jgi:hypothetical protein
MKYNSIDDAYNKEFYNLLGAAKSQLINQDYAIDCINNVFVKVLERKQKTGKENLKGFYLLRDLSREVHKLNHKISNERTYSFDDLQHDGGSIQGRVLPVGELRQNLTD